MAVSICVRVDESNAHLKLTLQVQENKTKYKHETIYTLDGTHEQC